MQKVMKIKIAHTNAVIRHGSSVRLMRQTIAVVIGAIKKTLETLNER
jgi:hypothetical protein